VLGTSHAQQRFSAGLILGLNFSQIDGDFYAGYHKVGLVGGLQGLVKIKEKVDVGIELRYSQIGSRSVPNNQNTINPFNASFNYAEIPVTLIYKDWHIEDEDYYRIHFHGGLTYGRLISTNIKNPESSSFTELLDFFNDNYFGYLVGFTYFINEKFGATVRFNRSITFLYKNDDTNPNHNSLFNKHLTFSGIYKF